MMDPVTIEGPVPQGITIRGNGDRIMRARGGATLRNLTLTNGGGANGTAIWADGGTLLLENTTVRDGFGKGPAILGPDVTLVNSTIAHNAPGAGIGQWGSPGLTPIATLRNSIVANNGIGSPTPKNCATALGVTAVGLNISDDYSCGSSATIYVADPRLLGLADNGGPSPTESFDYRSPALNAGVNCCVATDQRYVTRDANCDIGAFEFTDFTVVTLTVDANTSVRPNGSAVVTGTVRCSRNGDVFGVLVDLQQRKGTKTPILVQGQGGSAVNCTTTPQPWSAPITPSAGTFDSGNGTVTARTNDTSIWIKPAAVTKTVKLRK